MRHRPDAVLERLTGQLKNHDGVGQRDRIFRRSGQTAQIGAKRGMGDLVAGIGRTANSQVNSSSSEAWPCRMATTCSRPRPASSPCLVVSRNTCVDKFCGFICLLLWSFSSDAFPTDALPFGLTQRCNYPAPDARIGPVTKHLGETLDMSGKIWTIRSRRHQRNLLC